MAKKSRRARKKARATRPKPPIRQTPAQHDSVVDQPAPAIAKEPSHPGARAKKTVDFATEYHYVYADLKRIAVTATVMLAVLVILSFVIR
jgi:negative regulator of sigma E activity